MNEEEIRVVENMEKYGGNFIKSLAQCFYRADRFNFIKLKETFEDYWKDYEKYQRDN